MTITPDQITLGMQISAVERELVLRHQVLPAHGRAGEDEAGDRPTCKSPRWKQCSRR